jgi:uncharacterized protein
LTAIGRAANCPDTPIPAPLHQPSKASNANFHVRRRAWLVRADARRAIEAAAHCTAKKIDPAVIMGTRLTPDMLPFVKQVQLTCDFAKNGIGRMVGEPPKFPDEEKTFDELKARITKTLDYVRSIKVSEIDAAADKDVTFPVGPQSMTLPGVTFLTSFVLPNFYFHATTAYDILRQVGVEIGKRDFLGRA